MYRWLERFYRYWRVKHPLSAIPLPFAPSPSDIREWKVEICPVGTRLSRSLPHDGVMQVSLHRLLIESGIALSKATSSWDPRSWFALYRYGGDFTGTAPKLRFYDGVQDKDPRLTAVASEEVATGITCYILREHFGLAHIADAYACIQRGELNYVSPTSLSRPDYFCQDASGETVLAESKGATGTRCKITGRIDPEGWSQVQNVRPVNLTLRPTCSRVVIGTHFCVDGKHNNSETTTIIKDPDGVESHERNTDSDAVIRLAYAKVLRFSGLDMIADRLVSGGELSGSFPETDISRLPAIKNLKVLPLGLTPFGDTICLYGPTAKALFSSNTKELRTSVQESLMGFRNQGNNLDFVGYALSNGTIIIHNDNELQF